MCFKSYYPHLDSGSYKNRKRGAENLFKELGSGKPRVLNKQQHHAYIH